MTPRETALAFADAINGHAVERLLSLMTPGHRLVDSLGNVVQGRASLAGGWKQYFTMVPDYRLEITQVLDGPPVMLLGSAGGTFARDGIQKPANRWSTPVAIRVEVQGELVQEWRIYADNEPIRALMRTPAG